MTLKNISSKFGLHVMDNKEHNQVAREDSTRNKENCHKLLLLSQKIRYVGIINNFGKTISGYFSFTLLSATRFMLSVCLILTTPKCFGLLPDVGRCFLIPPLPTFVRTTIIPCFALYPNLWALSNLLGLSILCMVDSFLHVMALFLSSSELVFHIFVHISAIY